MVSSDGPAAVLSLRRKIALTRATSSRGPVAVIDFDSHTDAWDSYFGEKYNHGTWMRRAIEEGLVDVEHSIEVGLRGSLYDGADWTGLRTELGLILAHTIIATPIVVITVTAIASWADCWLPKGFERTATASRRT